MVDTQKDGAGKTKKGTARRGRDRKCHDNNYFQTPPSYRSGRYGFGVFGAQDSVLCDRCSVGDASRLFLDHFSKHLSSVLGRTELCHEVRNPGPQNPKSSTIKTTTWHCSVFATCHDNSDNFTMGSRLSVGAGPTFPSAWRGHSAEVRSSPRGESVLTISEESFKATPLSER